MEIEQIAYCVEAGISVLAFIFSMIAMKKKKPKVAKTVEEIAAATKEVAEKYFEKQCKKNNIEIEQK